MYSWLLCWLEKHQLHNSRASNQYNRTLSYIVEHADSSAGLRPPSSHQRSKCTAQYKVVNIHLLMNLPTMTSNECSSCGSFEVWICLQFVFWTLYLTVASNESRFCLKMMLQSKFQAKQWWWTPVFLIHCLGFPHDFPMVFPPFPYKHQLRGWLHGSCCPESLAELRAAAGLVGNGVHQVMYCK